MVKFIPTNTTIITQELAYQFIDELFHFYELPEDIVIDRDSKFSSVFWTRLFKNLKTNLSMISFDHPQSNRQTKQVNKIIEDMLQA